MTERELANIMERHEIRQISPMGEKFDPNLHQAIFEAPNTEVPPKTVIEVTQIGYIIGDRVLRPAMVGVSTGGPAPVPAPAADTAKTMEKNTDEENSPPGSNIDKSA
jgi:molecular chaperone GrpE